MKNSQLLLVVMFVSSSFLLHSVDSDNESICSNDTHVDTISDCPKVLDTNDTTPLIHRFRKTLRRDLEEGPVERQQEAIGRQDRVDDLPPTALVENPWEHWDGIGFGDSTFIYGPHSDCLDRNVNYCVSSTMSSVYTMIYGCREDGPRGE